MTAPKVFISYSHDNPAHCDRVLALANRLRREGVDANLDQYVESPAAGWALWSEKEMRRADYIIVICTENYRRRLLHEETGEQGKGVAFEANLIYQRFMKDRAEASWLIPVIPDRDAHDTVPDAFRGLQLYRIYEEKEYIKLYRRLTGQPEIVKPELGRRKAMPPREPVADFLERETSPDYPPAAEQVHIIPPFLPHMVNRRDQEADIKRLLRPKFCITEQSLLELKAENLSEELLAALADWRNKAPDAEHLFDENLDSLFDGLNLRGERRRFRLLIKEHAEKKSTRRPVICLIHGRRNECHDSFLERVQRDILPGVLGMKNHHGDVPVHDLIWPSERLPEAEIDGHFRRSLSETVLGFESAGKDDIQNEFVRSGPATIVQSMIYSTDWQHDGRSRFQRFLEFWNTWPQLPPGQVLLICFYVIYKPPGKQNWWQQRFSRRYQADLKGLFESAKTEAGLRAITGLPAALVTELAPVPEREVQRWVQRDRRVRQLCDTGKLRREVSRLYRDHSGADLPMEVLTERLLTLLQCCCVQTGLD